MFKLTRFSGEEVLVNPDLIKTIESGGDTVVTFISGDRILVKETPEKICQDFMEYKRSLFQRIAPEVMQINRS
jgi:flagellar protein FlbD